MVAFSQNNECYLSQTVAAAQLGADCWPDEDAYKNGKKVVCPRTVHAMYRPPHFGVPLSLVAAWSVTCGVHPEYLRPRPFV
ncbi:hypothetical protein I7I48_09856 [Histoplasma ohiense]|nr:hypothetical protein I7I48_09856 [Histoplasma ohiense (nom. inval.)]